MKNFSQKFIRLLALVCIMTANLFAQTPGQFCTINLGSIVGDVYGTYDCGGNCVPNGADISACVFFQYDINASYDLGYSDGEASVNPDDGVNQSDVDGAYFIGFGQGVASVEITECEEISTQNIPLYLSEGWSMFGYTCLEPIDAIDGFIEIVDNISIVKDYLGNAYLPEWGFNGIGSFEFARGYQIKMLQEVTDFQFCTTIAGGASQEELDAAYDNGYSEGAASVDITSNDADVYAEGAASVTPEDGITQEDLDAAHAMYEGWCESDIDNDGICDVDEVSGCMDASSCNYVSTAEFDDGSCDYVSCLDECGVINGDNSSCIDCAGLVNGTSEDLGCGCGNPAPQIGYDCDGNFTPFVGMQAEGGIVFYIDETGQHGLVADLQDIGVDEVGAWVEFNWWDAMDAAESATSQGYDDWYLPSIQELELMWNTIAQGSSSTSYNIGGFIDHGFWSSTGFEFLGQQAYYIDFSIGYPEMTVMTNTWRLRVIRAF